MKTIGIHKPLTSLGQRRLLDALGEVLSVRFEERKFGDYAGVDAWLFLEIDREDLQDISRSTLPCYVTIHDNFLTPCVESSSVEFSENTFLPSMLRGRQIVTDEAVKIKSLPVWLQDVSPLACKETAPIWAIQETGEHRHHYVSMSLKELNHGDLLFHRFHGKEFLWLLPLLLFLRSLVEDQRWKPPPLQACFMFDDPNLHWPTYGFIDFEEMVEHAHLNNYHVSFATIPLDAWFVHKPTASLFRKHPDRISLLIHGNDHIAKEFARPHSGEERQRILTQALSRISGLEHRAGVEVSRVMAAPHGACNGSFLAEMARLGFEAAAISRGSLRHYASAANSVRTICMGSADIIEGLPVFPRFPLSQSSRNSILIAALLRQPILQVGHHQDLSNGLQLLEELSAFINSLGNVQWSDMKRISRSYYAQMSEGRILRVKMFTKRIEVMVPDGINGIMVERFWLEVSESEALAWRTLHESPEWMPHQQKNPIAVNPGQAIEIVSNPVTFPGNDNRIDRKLRPWPMGRRQLTEARDRLAPILKRVSARFTGD